MREIALKDVEEYLCWMEINQLKSEIYKEIEWKS